MLLQQDRRAYREDHRIFRHSLRLEIVDVAIVYVAVILIRARTRFPAAEGDLANASIDALPVVTRSEADAPSQNSKDSRGQTASRSSLSSEGSASTDSRRRNPDDGAALSAASAFGLSLVVASE